MGEEWVKKYRPKKSVEVRGQDAGVSALVSFIRNFQRGNKPLFLYGPPGTGKTSSIIAVAEELNLEVVEINASDTRNKSSISEVIGGALGQMSLIAKGKIILIDEIDGISGTKDRGGLPELIRLIEKSHFPVILTANDPNLQKFTNLRKKCTLVEFSNLSVDSVEKKLKEIAKLEKIEFDDEAIKTLARKTGGDLRAGINDLQTLSNGKKLTKDDVDILGDRKRKETIFQGLLKVFKTTSAEVALPAFDDVSVDINEIFLWIEQNLPLEYTKYLDLQRGFDNLSLADVFFGRIRRWQHYRFYVYCYNLLTAGIALSKDEKYPGVVKYQRSTKPLKIWMSNNKLAKKKSIASKLAEKTHTSTRVAIQELPYLVAAQDKDLFQMMVKDLELDDAEEEFLKK